jgi:outer membrane protein OmpA-like peptidoglycan-associated protein
MNENPTMKIKIEGHTDNAGDDDKNMKLSEDRAAAVKTYLVSKGVSEDRITSEGFGETMPIADNNTAAGKTKNRRVELKVAY